jgi:hypothetical protein
VLVDSNSENVKHLREAGGIERITTINNSRENTRFHARVVKAAGQVLKAIWSNKSVHSLLKKDGWNKNHFQPTITIDTLPRKKAFDAQHPSPTSTGGRRAQRTTSVDEVKMAPSTQQHTSDNVNKAPADSWV